MDNPTTLLVAIMFVTIVVTGLVGILMCLSEWVTGAQKIGSLQTGWLVFLLFTYFNYFWNTTLLLEIEGWTFLSFIGFIIGPVVLLFATNMAMVEAPGGAEKSDLERHYLNYSTRFFLLLFLVQVWLIGLDFSFDSVAYPTYLTGVTGLVFLALSFTKNTRAHVVGAVVAWIALVIQLIKQSLG